MLLIGLDVFGIAMNFSCLYWLKEGIETVDVVFDGATMQLKLKDDTESLTYEFESLQYRVTYSIGLEGIIDQV